MRRLVLILALVCSLAAWPPSADATLAYSRVTVATTATLIFTAPLSGMARVLVRNPSAVSVYVGDVSVLTTTGFEIAAGDAVGINLDSGDKLYGIVAAATQVVYTIRGSNPQ